MLAVPQTVDAEVACGVGVQGLELRPMPFDLRKFRETFGETWGGVDVVGPQPES